MPTTLTALLILLVAVLPGAVHTWAFERVTGQSDHAVGDRVPRLVAASAIYLVLSSPAIPVFTAIARSVASGHTTTGWRYLTAAVLLVIFPWVVGSAAGEATVRRHRKGLVGWFGRRIGGAGHANRAWDHLFATKDLTGTIRVVLTDKTCIIGIWAQRSDSDTAGQPPASSYASGYPSEQRDLFLSKVLRIDYPDGRMVEPGGTALVPAGSILYLEFYPDQETET